MPARTTGLLITFEGVEGCGKTTQLGMLSDRLRQQRVPLVTTREPGGTEFGQAIRRILLDVTGPPRDAMAELLLYLADRRQDLCERIRPALAEGAVVLGDRYHDATLAYQGFARGVPLAAIQQLSTTLDIIRPDLTLLLDMDPATALERAIRRNQATAGGQAESRFEAEDLAFHRRVREGYLHLAAMEPDRFCVLDAQRDATTVFQELWRAFANRFSDLAME